MHKRLYMHLNVFPTNAFGHYCLLHKSCKKDFFLSLTNFFGICRMEFKKDSFYYYLEFTRLAKRPAASPLPEKFWEMQIWGCHPRSTESDSV